MFPFSVRKLSRYLVYASGLKKDLSVSRHGRDIVFRSVQQSIILHDVAVNGVNAYEPELTGFIDQCLASYDCFIDGGANVGFITALAECVPQRPGKIIAIDPLPENAAVLRRLKAENSMNFEIIEAAIAGKSGKNLELFVPVGKKGAETIASLINRFDDGDKTFDAKSRRIMVDTVSLEEICRPHQGNILCKLDCEGAELDILAHSPNVLQRDNVDFILEINIGDKTKTELFQLMQSRGYSGYLMTSAGLVAEDRPLTLPPGDNPRRTLWRNHFFTKKKPEEVQALSLKAYGGWI